MAPKELTYSVSRKSLNFIVNALNWSQCRSLLIQIFWKESINIWEDGCIKMDYQRSLKDGEITR